MKATTQRFQDNIDSHESILSRVDAHRAQETAYEYVESVENVRRVETLRINRAFWCAVGVLIGYVVGAL